MNLLFVDDEELILNGLRRSLYNTGWKITCRNSAEAALELLKSEEFDVIISDMQMPGMDGLALLKITADLYPGMIRIVLSGYADQESSLKTSFVAHQWLNKPCEKEILVEALKKIEIGLQHLPSNEIRATIGATGTLPSPPYTYIKIRQILSGSSASFEEVANIITLDPALTAKVLQLTNSAFFAQGPTIVDIREAIVRLGCDLVSQVVLLSEIYAQGSDSDYQNQLGGHLHALVTSKLASEIAPQDLKSEATLAGLLHDVGKHTLIRAYPEHADAYIAAHNNRHNQIQLVELEEKLFLSNHAQTGAYLLLLWGFPSSIVEGVLYHHNPKKLMQEDFTIATSIYIANDIAHHQEPDQALVERFNLQAYLPKWKEMIAILESEN